MHLLPTFQTKLLLVLFFIVYIGYLTRSAARNHIDIYDYFALSCVALLPLTFGLLPEVVYLISDWMGVAFPFVVLFGALFVVIFAYLHRLLTQLNRQMQINKHLIQEISLLKAALETGNLAPARAANSEPPPAARPPF